ncbi:acetyl-CoA carboxylase carboxyltransferase subunit beta [bacterium]|nr:acetyl-CoA carboxylase carboxyltransferase subunit beta [bacterium]
MCAWFSRIRAPKPTTTEESDRLQVPTGLWTKCNGCSEIIYTREIERNENVCPKCEHHFRLNTDSRIRLLLDRQSFEEMDQDLKSVDPLAFKDTIKYRDRIRQSEKKTGKNEAVRTGFGRVNGRPIGIGIFEFAYMGGSMGPVVGEKLTRMIEKSIEQFRPVVILSSSGGARMQEGIYSLMQMAKISAALHKLGEKGLPYISILTDPTTGGVAASFAMQGDIIIAEPGALIGFAGPRVIEQTIKRKLPEGFQRSEFLLTHGMVDLVIHRKDLRQQLANLLEMLCWQH